ncbi:protein glass-like [Rhipicephalus sanguineus]|uniref:protein glass-like n=1 Tax=Rhipicephalus sanguineus TaxID=34632 RepID=UPI0020C1F7D3|nr:protein glass-like [Rhipicephalus sanguineus]
MCPLSFKLNSTLKTHLRTHTGLGSSSYPATKDGEKWLHGRRHRCDFCDYETDRLGSLKGHVRVHTGERPFHCHMCPQRFSLNSTLKKHLRTHTGERPFKCHLCSETFVRKHRLDTHLRQHEPK